MYGRRMTLRDNLVAFNRGPSGYGIGLKDMDDSVITGNRILDNRVGVFNDGSPREMDSIGIFENNLFAYNDIAMEMLPSVRHNRLQDNSFIENEQQVVIAGGGRLGENDWTPDGRGNHWSDYAGYDADGDGLGDIEFRSEHLLDDLLSRQPELRLFLYSPVVNAVEFAARAFPLVRPQPILVDSAPLTQPVPPTAAPLPVTSEEGVLWPVLILPFGLLTLLAVTRISRRRYHMPKPATSTAMAGRIEQRV
jgi:nitrous oxidase accessory protein